MNKLFIVLGLVMAASLGSSSQASEAKDAKPAAPQGTPITLKGHLIKGDAGVAALNVIGEDAKAHKKVILYAEGDLATQVADLLKKHATVEASGNLAADGISLKLEKIEETKEAKGGNGNGDKPKKPKTP